LEELYGHLLDILALMAKSFLHDDSGVSVIIGAMLLILITVVAAAGLALIVSQTEKQAAQRQALQSAVDNEHLKIASIYITNGLDGNIKYITVDIMNLNTADSKVMAISLNGYYAKNFSDNITHAIYNITDPMTIPGSGHASIDLDLEYPGNFSVISPDPPQIPVNGTIKVELTTSYINYFSRVYHPPIAAMKIDVGTDKLTDGINRDYLSLDGTGSTSDNGSIMSWEWTVSNVNTKDSYTFNGRNVRAQLNSLGPFNITLKVTDDSKLIGTSMMQMPDQNFDQLGSPIYVTLDSSHNNDILVNLVDILNNFIGGVKVTYQPENPVTGPQFAQPYAYTDQYGFARLNHVSGSGNVNVTIANGSNPYTVELSVP
jgi:FlaG/FlaF family flagellin (archaellin)